jgi:excisionase family DNA binding protein
MDINSNNNDQETQTQAVKTSPKANQPEKKYLSILEASEYMGVHPNTIRNWIRYGNLNAGRVGLRTIRVLKSDLDQLLTRYKAGEYSKWNISR